MNSLVHAVGAAEDDDVARLRVGEAIGHLVDEHPVVVAAGAAVQGRLHRPGRDDVDLRDERLDEERQHQCDDDEDRQFLPERRPSPPTTPAFASLRGSLLAVIRGRPLVGRPACSATTPPADGLVFDGLLHDGLRGSGDALGHGGRLGRAGTERRERGVHRWSRPAALRPRPCSAVAGRRCGSGAHQVRWVHRCAARRARRDRAMWSERREEARPASPGRQGRRSGRCRARWSPPVGRRRLRRGRCADDR